ncbi:hypothetical protein [Mobilicoccus caccae]|uniref:hypothetical protein n=1 Tax=Mobilicoccus caccae TaxID=1859295 RepID=UPI0024E0EB54|nr:hypothetical protein [Mobilicoccus caccae]
MTIRAGAFVGTAIVDHQVEIERDARIGVETGDRLPAEEDVSLVGRQSRVGRGVVIDSGARLEPGTTA